MKIFHGISILQILNNPMLLVLLYGIYIATIALSFYSILLDPEHKIIRDFDIFYLTGQLYWEDKIVSAYNSATLLEAQQAYSSAMPFMPWTYPPQYNFLTAVLALLPVEWAYFVFATTTLISYTLILRAIAGPWIGICSLIIFPSTIITLLIGQNGLLTGTLIGLSVIGILARRTWAGLPIGFLVIKPHLAIGIGFLTLIRCDWKTIVLALAVVAASSLLAILNSGMEIWIAFLGAIEEAKGLLSAGSYPLHRMVSVYTTAYMFGMPASIALGLQIIAAMVIISLILIGFSSRWKSNHLLALSIIALPYISPYLHDYDMVFLGIAFALTMSDLMRFGTVKEILFLVVLSWSSSSYGLIASFFDLTQAFNVSCFSYTAMLMLTIGILRRSYRPVTVATV